MDEVKVVVAHSERATLRVGDVFLKVDADEARIDVEVEAMALAPVPTPEVLWRRPPVLAIAAVPGTALGRLGEPSTASPAAWAAAGAAIRKLHDAPLPPWTGRRRRDPDELAAECLRADPDLRRSPTQSPDLGISCWHALAPDGRLRASCGLAADRQVLHQPVIAWHRDCPSVGLHRPVATAPILAAGISHWTICPARMRTAPVCIREDDGSGSAGWPWPAGRRTPP